MCRNNAQFNYMDWIGISIVFDILMYIHILHRYIVYVYIYIYIVGRQSLSLIYLLHTCIDHIYPYMVLYLDNHQTNTK